MRDISFTKAGKETIVINGSCNQPPVAQGQDVAVFADDSSQADADVNNGSFDPDGDDITREVQALG